MIDRPSLTNPDITKRSVITNWTLARELLTVSARFALGTTISVAMLQLNCCDSYNLCSLDGGCALSSPVPFLELSREIVLGLGNEFHGKAC